MVIRDKKVYMVKKKKGGGVIIIKLERRETEISYFLSQENNLNVFKSRREKSKGLTAM